MSSRFIPPFFDAGNGITPSSGAKLFFFELDGVTPRDTFFNEAATGGSENTNPVVSDNDGLFGDIWITGSYKVILQDKNSVQIWVGTPIRELPSLTDAVTVKNFATLAEAVADVNLVVGDALNLEERTTGNAGGAMWDVVLASSVTPNTFNIVICTGIATLALVLRAGGRAVNVREWNATGDGSTDDTLAVQAAIDFDQGIRGRGVYFPAGTYGVTSNLLLNGANTQFGIKLYGDGLNASLLTIITGFSGADDNNCLVLLDGTSMTNHRKSWVDLSISDLTGIAPSGFSGVNMRNGAFENDFTRIWFATSKTHIDIDQDSLGPLINDCVFDTSSNTSIRDASFKPSIINDCIFVSNATAFPTIDFIYNTLSPRTNFPISFGGSVNGCLFLNEYRAISIDGNQGLQVVNNKFQVTSEDSNKFILALNSKALTIADNVMLSSDGGTGKLTNECIVISSTPGSTISGNVFYDIEGAGITLIDADFTTINGNTFTTVQQPCIQFETTQSRGCTIDANLFQACGTAATHNVIECNVGRQTRILITDNVFEGTLGDFDILASNTVFLLDNLYTNLDPSTDVSLVTFTGILRDFQAASDANDTITPSASYVQAEAVAIVTEVHDLMDKLRTAGYIAS